MKKTEMWIQLPGSLNVKVVRKTIRHLYLRVLPPDGQVQVSAPLGLPEQEIRRFLEERRLWIAARQAEMQQKREKGLWEPGIGERISLWGRSYPLRVETGAARSQVVREPDAVVLQLAGEDTREAREQVIREWYRKLLQEEVRRLVPLWEQRMQVPEGAWQIRAMRSRWGSCHTRTGKVVLNLYLAARPYPCLEYVIVHELAHRQEPNHGPAFWALVERFLPDWKERRQQLR